ncbi:MAG: Uma2 family endonuclease [Richelia sp. RM2_1_2]|nr:Uma2 family endonuclease [Richelia sp. SM2_1_7]NJM21032.1 Uma2 family endonuclease [Richelia sp. SM1_7_0]NJN08538.1 Uma2 family endonuclease [Richelia sp. RM1_1_1]NJO27556.1 Uma2 family endonuclease [Richelia sp. SL_2_1]NJO57282.1 Uma2 family endonuclease [Richelia sp. RM2_1_2]
MTIFVKKNVNTIPLLESGDRLTRNEFERRYTAMPDNMKAELIEGIVYMTSPLSIRSHGEPHANLIGWLWSYKIATQGLILGDNSTVRLDLDNEPQPDVVLFIDENLGGQARISEDDYIEGSPELVAEVAASSASYDLYDKKNAFRRNGVLEYIVWQIFENKLDWFCLQDGEYICLEADEEGIIKSRVFPGLWLATSALLTGDMKQVLYILQQGLNSSEHAEVVKQLIVDS